MRESKSPFSFNGNGASSLAQSIGKIGEAFGGLRKEKQRLNDKMLDSEIRIRERAITDTLRSSLKSSEMKSAGKQERKTYKSQIKANVKAAERLTGTEKGQGVVKAGSKVSFGRERMDFTSKESPKPEAPKEAPKPKNTRAATSKAKPATKPTAAPKPAATPKAAPAPKPAMAPKPAVRKTK